MKIILCEKNLSAYRSAAREIPAVRTSVIPTDNALSGGCNAADAISQPADAINKISLNAAEIFAKIAGKNLFRLMKSPSSKKFAESQKFPAEIDFKVD